MDRDIAGTRGSATVVVVAVAALCVVALAGLGLLARDALDAARAQSVADGYVLADVTSGELAARHLVAATGGEVVRIERRGHTTEVAIRVGDVIATAAAERPVTAGGRRDGLAPAMVAALARAEELLGFEVHVVSGYRTHEQQRWLWNARHDNPYPVAPPGTSLHERGLAIDVPLSVVSALRSVAFSAGLCHPLPESDPVHFTVCPADP